MTEPWREEAVPRGTGPSLVKGGGGRRRISLSAPRVAKSTHWPLSRFLQSGVGRRGKTCDRTNQRSSELFHLTWSLAWPWGHFSHGQANQSSPWEAQENRHTHTHGFQSTKTKYPGWRTHLLAGSHWSPNCILAIWVGKLFVRVFAYYLSSPTLRPPVCWHEDCLVAETWTPGSKL